MSSKALAAVSLVVLGTLVGGGIVWARGNASQITACVEPRTNYLKLGDSCGGQQLTWNTEGPAGPKGDAGPAGPKGDQGPKGDPATGPDRASKAEVAARTRPTKGLRRAGKPNLVALGKLKVPVNVVTQGVVALSTFHDEPVVIPSVLNALGDSSKPWETAVAHLDVPAGKYVIVAKARALNTNPNAYSVDDTAGVLCYLVAGVDSDAGNATHWNMLALTVVHSFSKPGRVQLNCTRATAQTVMELEAIKITAIRVNVLKNAYVAAG
jgi:hypothetical protein